VVKKGLWALVLLAFLGSARCYNADLANAFGGLPIVGPMVVPPEKTPAYIDAIGTPVAPALPETDLATFFPVEAPADSYDATRWGQIAEFVTIAGTPSGWALTCKAASDAAGADRAASPLMGALACSSDPTVTQFQHFAAHVLGAQASLALWIKGAPNGTLAAVQGRQAELRVFCTTGVVARQGAENAVWAEACAGALDAGYLSGDGPATFEALDAAYAAAAAEIARLDPETDQEPGYFGPPAAQ